VGQTRYFLYALTFCYAQDGIFYLPQDHVAWVLNPYQALFMKRNLSTILLLLLLTTACNKNNTRSPQPIANFSAMGDTTGGVLTVGTYDQIQLQDNSVNANSWQWNFGNASNSTQQSATIWYPSSGTYTITLTVENTAGGKDSMTRKVRVLDRVIRQVTINGMANDLKPAGHSLDHASIWAVIKLGQNNATYPFPAGGNLSFNAPVVYQTPVITNVDSTRTPFVFPVPGKVIVDFPALLASSESGLGYNGIGHGLELYAQDATGTYLLSSSYEYFFASQSGSITWPIADIQKNLFVMQYGNVTVNCDYE
jgi:PKD repeat protein